jgi:hypothetical protein
MTKNFNERNAFIDQLSNNIPKGSIILFDRGYESIKLISDLISKGLKFIIRMKINSLMVKSMILDKLTDKLFFTNEYGAIRVIKYVIEGEDYYLATNIFIKSVTDLKIMYHSRWTVEEHFKIMKCTLQTSNFTSNTFDKNNQSLYVQLLLIVLASLFKRMIIRYHPEKIKNGKTINFINIIHIMNTDILKQILFKTGSKKIMHCLKVASEFQVCNEPNRSYDRKRITPVSKWYYVGLRFKKK